MSRAISREQREAVWSRSGGRCEAVIDGKRCDRRQVQIQHRVRQGGHLLDRVGETRHLAAACVVHHRQADHRELRGGFLLDGNVEPGCTDGYMGWDKLSQRPYYVGADPLMSSLYPSVQYGGAA